MGLWGIYWTSVGDLTHYACVRACVCVLFGLSCRVPYYGAFHLYYCVHSHFKAIRFYRKSWSWELWSRERRNRQPGLPPSTSLRSWSLVAAPISAGATVALSHAHFDSVALSVLDSPHMGASVSGHMRGTNISELPQISASLLGPILFVLAVLWMLLMPPTHRLGVFVPPGPIEDSPGRSSTNDIADWSHLAC